MPTTEQRDRVVDMLRSDGWKIVVRDIIEPLKEGLWSNLKGLKVGEAEIGPVWAGQIRFLDKLLTDIDDYARGDEP